VSKTISMAAVGVIVASLLGGTAYAHPQLQSADPAPGAATTTSPKQIRISFDENLIPKMSGVEVKDQTGKIIPTGKAATDPANKKLLVVPINDQLPPGDYKVEWHAVSDDTHRVKGSFSFSVTR
jgi:methionine-rich copper-binding protein CopC